MAAAYDSRGNAKTAKDDLDGAITDYTQAIILDPNRHAIALGYVTSSRNAHYPDLPDTHQSVGTVGVYYTLLGDTKFGLRDWRSPDTGETTGETP